MKKAKHVISSLLVLLTIHISGAQQQMVTGTVTDTNGTPLPGVSIIQKNTTNGVASDFDGNFNISVPSNAILVFSALGFGTQEIPLNGQANLNITLAEDTAQLDEVVVVAYGSQTKKSLVGAVSSLDSETLEKQQLTSVTSAFQGTVAGVNVVNSGGQPGSNPIIRIRGIGSINADAGPLYIVDGVPFNGNLNSISADQIESMNVLKDASSTALYGSRAANGVVIITTKKGKYNSNLEVTASVVTGISSPAVKLHEAEGAESYLRHYWEARRNTFQYVNGQTATEAGANAANGIIDELGYNPYNVSQPIDANGNIVPGARLLWDTDWQNALVNTNALRNDYTVGITGGGEKSRYFVSFNYLDQEGSMRNSDFQRITTRINIESKLTDWLTLGLNSSISTSKANNPNQSGGSIATPIGWAYGVASVYPIHRRDAMGAYILDALGNKIYDYGNNGNALNGSRPLRANYNAVGSLFDDVNIDKNTNIITNGFVEMDFTDYLSFKTNIAYQNFLFDGYDYANPFGGFGRDLGGQVSQNRNITTTLNVNNNLKFSKSFGEHTINANAIFETYQYKFDRLGATGTDFIADVAVLNGAATPTNINGFINEERLTSYLGRLGYNYKNKYFIEGSFRRDGSTKFSKDTRWGNFYSIGGSWIISDEGFLKISKVLNLLKLRASYGELGNNSGFGIFPYRQGFITGVSNLDNSGVILGGVTDPNLTWETTAITDFGIDFGLFNNRFEGTVGYFNKESIDLIYSQPLPGSTGNTSITTNIGSIKNYGLEFSLNADIMRSEKITWSAGINLTKVTNEVTELTQESVIRGNKRLEEGRSIFDFFIREWAGVDPDDGYGMWYRDVLDANGEPTGERETTKVFSEADRYYVGSSLPDLTGGFTTSVQLGNFDFNTLFSFSFGGKIYDGSLANLSAGYEAIGNPNGVNVADDRWQQPGDITDTPLFLAASNNFNDTSTRFLFDNDYVRMRAITLGYNLPEDALKSIFINTIRLYLRGDNLVTWQSHKGIDPEQDLGGGTDNRSPQLRTISLGVNVKF